MMCCSIFTMILQTYLHLTKRTRIVVTLAQKLTISDWLIKVKVSRSVNKTNLTALKSIICDCHNRADRIVLKAVFTPYPNQGYYFCPNTDNSNYTEGSHTEKMESNKERGCWRRRSLAQLATFHAAKHSIVCLIA